MQVQINTDRTVDGADAAAEGFEAQIRQGLARFEKHLTRIEAHLGDHNSQKGGQDDRSCSLEARPTGQKPVAVNHDAATTEEALSGAIRKMRALLDTQLGRLNEVKGAPTIRGGEIGS